MKNKCYECRNYLGCGYDAETQACHNFMPKGKTTVFDRLISSPEVLAPFLVFHNRIYKGRTKYHSAVVGGEFDSYKEAIAATVARLNEVKDE